MNYFNLAIAVFSTAGVLGWKIWDQLPVAACFIIAAISLAKLIQPHLIPSEKQIEKLDKIADFYFDFFLQLERLWLSAEHRRIDDYEIQSQLHTLKQKEREINTLVNEIHKRSNKRLAKKATADCNLFFQNAFNTTNL